MASKYIKRFKVPNDFENILSDFAKEILRNQPKDIIDFGIEYFKGLESNTKFDYKDKGENRPENYKRPENQEPKIISAPNNLAISKEDENRLQKSMDKIERINKDPVPGQLGEGTEGQEVVSKGEEVERGKHVSKYVEEKEESNVVTEEVHVRREVHVVREEKIIRNGEVIKDEKEEKHFVKEDGGDENGQNKLLDEEEGLVQEKSPDFDDGYKEGGGRYGGPKVEENEEHKKEYDDWFTKHSMDKQVIERKPEEEKLDENLKRSGVEYDQWFEKHSVKSNNASQNVDSEGAVNKTENDIPKEGKGEIKLPEYNEWFLNHCKNNVVIANKDERKEPEYEVIRNEMDYATWFENHSKLTNK